VPRANANAAVLLLAALMVSCQDTALELREIDPGITRCSPNYTAKRERAIIPLASIHVDGHYLCKVDVQDGT
jgi:hypothetical protein